MAEANPIDAAKQAAAVAGVALVEDGMKLGLGSGSTAMFMVRELGARAKADGLRLRCAASSEATARLAQSVGLTVEPLDALGRLDLTLDGADEIDPDLSLIKGGGGAHTREKIVAAASDRMVVLADPMKVVDRLGAFRLPVEVLAFGLDATRGHIAHLLDRQNLSDRPILLRGDANAPYRTDEGNLILDLALEAIAHPEDLAAALSAIPGVVDHGLFIGLCKLALIGQPDGSFLALEAETIPEEDQA